jgi:hypothetical protein
LRVIAVYLAATMPPARWKKELSFDLASTMSMRGVP